MFLLLIFLMPGSFQHLFFGKSWVFSLSLYAVYPLSCVQWEGSCGLRLFGLEKLSISAFLGSSLPFVECSTAFVLMFWKRHHPQKYQVKKIAREHNKDRQCVNMLLGDLFQQDNRILPKAQSPQTCCGSARPTAHQSDHFSWVAGWTAAQMDLWCDSSVAFGWQQTSSFCTYPCAKNQHALLDNDAKLPIDMLSAALLSMK